MVLDLGTVASSCAKGSGILMKIGLHLAKEGARLGDNNPNIRFVNESITQVYNLADELTLFGTSALRGYVTRGSYGNR